MIVLAVVAWLLVGYAGFVWWWTSEWDLTARMARLGLLAAPVGPVAWVIGRIVHGESRKRPHGRNPSSGRVLVRCRWRP